MVSDNFLIALMCSEIRRRRGLELLSTTDTMPDLTNIEQSIRSAFSSGRLTQVGAVPKSNSGFGARFANLDLSGRCDDPVNTIVEGALPEMGVPGRYRTQSNAKHRDHTEGHLSVSFLVPCRRCGPCLRQRAWRWATAAEREITRAAAHGRRTWFGTLTLSPQSHFEMLLRAERHAGHQVEGTEDEFALRHAAVSRELTLALKRIRKRKGGSNAFRYLLVAEKHKSGLPHYHMLLHEQEATVLKSELNGFWPWGHSQWRLVRLENEPAGKPARYIAKYLSKSAEARVRASQDYGGEGSGELLWPPGWTPLGNRSPGRERAEAVATVKPAPPQQGGETPEGGRSIYGNAEISTQP